MATKDATHSADVDYADLLPDLFEIRAGRFYMQLASEVDKDRVLSAVQWHRKPDQFVYVGVIDPIDPEVESPETVRDRVLQAARYIPVDSGGRAPPCHPGLLSRSSRSRLQRLRNGLTPRRSS